MKVIAEEKYMVKSELINSIASKIPVLNVKDIESAVNQILHKMTETLCNGERIEIRGFGSFELRYRAPRNAHNPKTGIKVITIPKYAPHFKPGKELRERVNQSRHLPIKNED
jgi:integration host factor subunit beta